MSTATDASTDASRQAVAQVESIARLIDAYSVDYDRLEELRDERKALVDASEDATEDYDRANGDPDYTPQEVDRLAQALRRAEKALMDWMAENQEELDDLAEAAGDCADRDEAEQRIHEDPLSVEFRSGWTIPGEPLEADEFRIVLCTGGPHVEIIGEFDAHDEPSNPRIIFKDWGESGELFEFDHAAVTEYCSRIIGERPSAE